MILVDSSVWMEHLRRGVPDLAAALNRGQVLCHPFVIGELALGNLGRRTDIVEDLRNLPRAPVAEDDEVLTFIGRHRLFGRGIGYVDAHLLASVRLAGDARLWTLDGRLGEVAGEHGVAVRLKIDESERAQINLHAATETT